MRRQFERILSFWDYFFLSAVQKYIVFQKKLYPFK